MKSIRQQLKPISLFMAFLVLFVSCEQYDETPINKDFPAKDVFKSVMFGTGEFASNLSIFDAQQKSVENIETAQREEMLKNIELLVNAIESNPFYSDFSIAMVFKKKPSKKENYAINYQRNFSKFQYTLGWYIHFIIWASCILLLINSKSYIL